LPASHPPAPRPWRSYLIKPELVGDATQSRRRGFRIDAHHAAEEELGIQVAQREVGVGDGWLCAAAAVAGRARLRAYALRPDM
jgi:hypothetical protein